MIPLPAAPALPDDDYARFCALVQKASGLDIPPVRRGELEQAVRQAQARAGLADHQALYEHLTQMRGRAALHGLVEALTIGETHFFRNQPQFHALTHHLLPEIIQRRRAERRLRLWSAGCATGEEAYSLAILVDRLLPPGEPWDVHLLGTDINRQSLEKAKRGLYGAWSFREVPEDIQAHYFIQHARGADTDYEVVPRLRHRITWDYLNLIEAVYPSTDTGTLGMDLILFRNVLIYFNEATARAVVDRLHASLSEGGWLVVGHADTSLAVFHQFAVHNFPGAVLYQKRPPQAPQAPPLRAERPAPPAARPAPPKPATAPLRPTPSAASAPPAAPNAQALFAAAKHQADQHNLDAALHSLEAALRLDPLLAPAHYLHGLILQERGQAAAAQEALRRCVYADPRFVLGHYALGSLLARQGQTERARKSLENVTRLLADRPRDELIPQGDSLTVGRLLEMAALHKDIQS